MEGVPKPVIKPDIITVKNVHVFPKQLKYTDEATGKVIKITIAPNATTQIHAQFLDSVMKQSRWIRRIS